MIRKFCFLLFSLVASAQPVTIKIDKITSTDFERARHFNIEFTVSNESAEPVSFFLNPKNFIPAQGGPLANAVFYKLYQENEVLEASNILGTRIEFNADGTSDKYFDYAKMTPSDIAELRKRQQNFYFESLITMLPGERRSYSKELMWDYKRYHQQADNEFYIEPDQKHFIELMVIFWREEYASKLSEEQFEAMMANDSMVKGWFASNKMEIDFSEKN